MREERVRENERDRKRERLKSVCVWGGGVVVFHMLATFPLILIYFFLIG